MNVLPVVDFNILSPAQLDPQFFDSQCSSAYLYHQMDSFVANYDGWFLCLDGLFSLRSAHADGLPLLTGLQRCHCHTIYLQTSQSGLAL